MDTRKKIIAIAAVIVVAVGGIIAVAYIIGNENKTGTRPADSTTMPSVNKDEHLGTAKVVSQKTLQAAFGEGSSAAAPQESGTVNIGTTRSETATFAVKSPKGDVSFEVDVRTYASKADLEQNGPFVGAEEPKIGGVGEEAHYLIPYQQSILKEQQVALIVIKGKTSYKFALVQKSDNIVYDTDAAKAVVLEVAKKANLNEVK